MPAWRLVDPLPILDYLDDEGRDDRATRMRTIVGEVQEEPTRPGVTMNYLTARTKSSSDWSGCGQHPLRRASLGLILTSRGGDAGRARFCEAVAISSSAFISQHDLPAVKPCCAGWCGRADLMAPLSFATEKSFRAGISCHTGGSLPVLHRYAGDRARSQATNRMARPSSAFVPRTARSLATSTSGVDGGLHLGASFASCLHEEMLQHLDP
jgi:hypothetical protein